MKKNWVIFAIILLIVAGYAYKKFYAGRTSPVAADDTPQAPLPPLEKSTDNATLFGTLIIYDPGDAQSSLAGRGFVPQAWYLVPQNVDDKKGAVSPALDYQLSIDDNSVCTALSNQNIRWNCTAKGQVVPWGYGEKVKIQGFKNSRTVNVTSMTLINY